MPSLTFEEIASALKGRYDLERELGRGGMAIVYLATDRHLKRSVAVKVLRPELSAALGPERFVREIETAAKMQHPYIVSLYEAGEAGRFVYFTMPYLREETLRERLNREKELPILDAVRITCEVGRAMAYAHGQGIVHRDIKPDNILFSSGHAIVADFGVARAVFEAGGDRLTQTDVVIGTADYMSPEQAAGVRDVDARSDIYSLGCVLFEMLTGEPPIIGATPAGSRTRQEAQPPPTISIIRPTVRPALQAAIERALAKRPVDRFQTAAAFVEALEHAQRAPDEAPNPPHPGLLRRILGAGLITAAAAAILLALQPLAPLDSNKVVVFPLVESGVPRADSGLGYDVALAIGAALEHTNPLKWIDGWERLDERQRTNPVLVTADVARRITRDRGARYFIEGALRRRADTAVVVLRLNDAAGDSLILQSSAAGALEGPPPHQIGLTALRRLLPAILDPGRAVDLTALSDRHPAAIALWIQGERQYRRARFADALEFYRRAVDKDSALAFAAIKGAQAASWINRTEEASRLTNLALAHSSVLPPRYAYFARGLRAYLMGHADTAATWLARAVAEAPGWEEASMALGEVFYHLFPAQTPLDSLAESAFAASAAADTAFTPPLVHLAEIALRRGETRRAERLIDALERASPDRALERPLRLAWECLKHGPSTANWGVAAITDPAATFGAAKVLSAGVSQRACAETGFRTLLSTDGVAAGFRWGALLGLQGLLVAQRRDSEALHLIDSAVAVGTSQALSLYIVDLWAGAPTAAKAAGVDAFARQAFGENYVGMPAPYEWQIGIWHSWRGDSERVSSLQRALETEARQTHSRRAALYATALAAHHALILGDTTRALQVLESLHPTARRDSITYDFGEPLPVERLVLARLLLARAQFAEAFHVAATFDHQEPIVFLAFVPASLAIRIQAAEAVGRSDWAAAARGRLASLGRTDLLQSPPLARR